MIPATSKCGQLESSIAPALITVGLVANDLFADGFQFYDLIDPLNAESGLFCLFEILEVNIMIAARGAR